MADLLETSWKQIIAWGIFLLVIAGIAYIVYYVLENTDFGQIFSNLFGALNSVLHGLNSQIQSCDNNGWFSSGCWLGPLLVSAGVLLAFIPVVKFLLGPATETRIGRLWEQVTGKKVSVADMDNIQKKVEAAFEEVKAKNPKYQNMTEDQELLAKNQATAQATAKITTDTINKNPAITNKAELIQTVMEESGAFQDKARKTFESDGGSESDADLAEDAGDAIFHDIDFAV